MEKEREQKRERESCTIIDISAINSVWLWQGVAEEGEGAGGQRRCHQPREVSFITVAMAP